MPPPTFAWATGPVLGRGGSAVVRLGVVLPPPSAPHPHPSFPPPGTALAIKETPLLPPHPATDLPATDATTHEATALTALAGVPHVLRLLGVATVPPDTGSPLPRMVLVAPAARRGSLAGGGRGWATTPASSRPSPSLSSSLSLAECPLGMPPAEAGRVMHAVVTGLRGAHARGVAHRDVKGGNVLVGGGRRGGGGRSGGGGAASPTDTAVVVLADWGSALVAGGGGGVGVGGGGGSGPGHRVGTLQWSAPEAALGALPAAAGGAWSPSAHQRGWQAADVWSVGCTALELLTGEPPWGGGGGGRVEDGDGGEGGEGGDASGVLLRMAAGDDGLRASLPDWLTAPALVGRPGNGSDGGDDGGHNGDDDGVTAAASFVRACLHPTPHCRPTAAQLCGHPFVRGGLAPPPPAAPPPPPARHRPRSLPATPATTRRLLVAASSAARLCGLAAAGAARRDRRPAPPSPPPSSPSPPLPPWWHAVHAVEALPSVAALPPGAAAALSSWMRAHPTRFHHPHPSYPIPPLPTPPATPAAATLRAALAGLAACVTARSRAAAPAAAAAVPVLRALLEGALATGGGGGGRPGDGGEGGVEAAARASAGLAEARGMLLAACALQRACGEGDDDRGARALVDAACARLGRAVAAAHALLHGTGMGGEARRARRRGGDAAGVGGVDERAGESGEHSRVGGDSDVGMEDYGDDAGGEGEDEDEDGSYSSTGSSSSSSSSSSSASSSGSGSDAEAAGRNTGDGNADDGAAATDGSASPCESVYVVMRGQQPASVDGHGSPFYTASTGGAAAVPSQPPSPPPSTHVLPSPTAAEGALFVAVTAGGRGGARGGWRWARLLRRDDPCPPLAGGERQRRRRCAFGSSGRATGSPPPRRGVEGWVHGSRLVALLDAPLAAGGG